MPAQSALRSKNGLYNVHPSVKLVMDWASSLKVKTGRLLEEWITEVKKSGPGDTEARRKWLKDKHGLGTNGAWWIVDRAEGRGEEDQNPDAYLRAAEGWVEEMFSARKAGLRPIYDRLLKTGMGLGKDVRVCPCKTIVPLYREHVFAQLKPSTNSRLDLGLCLRGVKPTSRLISTGGEAKGDRITHRIAITSLDEIDDEVERWMKRAYSLAEKARPRAGDISLRE